MAAEEAGFEDRDRRPQLILLTERPLVFDGFARVQIGKQRPEVHRTGVDETDAEHAGLRERCNVAEAGLVIADAVDRGIQERVGPFGQHWIPALAVARGHGRRVADDVDVVVHDGRAGVEALASRCRDLLG